MKWVLMILLILVCLMAAIITPVAWIGIIILIFGVYQYVQKSKGKRTFLKPWIIVLVGFLFSWISAFALVGPSGEKAADIEEEKAVQDEDQLTEEQKQEEADRLAEVQRKQEEADRLAEEQQKQEEANRLAEEQRKQEEADRLAEEQRKQEEAARLAEEQRKQEEAARVAEEQRKQEEAARQAEEQEKATNVHYKNCTEAKEAGAAPIRKGEPGYGKHLDRDGDGIGCDK
ncbi:excalibur calcium-binding domain-containing protein [Bacillus dakarensis]|uniref:excalibur calcium-binding domain-containing protein n=1 Tax=Robertmurraya dakarensis TaxID=1926278 RepID=UPI0011159D4B|nr:excalibur calcium-binding domain-containing protein [Bacillus dakarensis]